MTPAIWQQVKQALDEALDMTPAEREPYLAKLQETDPEVHSEVLELLRAHLESTDFLERPAIPLNLTDLPLQFDPGQTLGAYRILRKIGEGGMGTVYEALREEDGVQLHVAIKLVRTIAYQELTDRFRAERQILARLAHPNIARLVDWGLASDGRPYFVMEHIQGECIDEFIRDRKFNVRQILELFLQVLEAVDYAHQRMIVHGDLKPSNILVTPSGTVKLLDFGIARLLDPHIEAKPGQSHAGLTPAYASPEQLRGDPLASVSDVFSLGVLLCELLTGHRPYNLQAATPAQMSQQLAGQEPRKPSKLAQNPDIRSELDCIVLRAIEQDPFSRYLSVSRLADDIRAFLQQRPVSAYSRSPWYVFRKGLVRHRVPVVVGTLGVVALSTALIAALLQTQRAETQRALAERRFEHLRNLTEFTMFELDDQIARLPGSTGVRASMVQRSTAYLDEILSDAGDNAKLRVNIAAQYIKLADILGRPGTANIGNTAAATDGYRKAISILEPLAKATEREAQAQLASAYLRYSTVLKVRGDFNTALTYDRKALEAARQLSGMFPNDIGYRRLVAQNYTNMGATLVHHAQWDEAERMRRKALESFEELRALNPNDESTQRGLALANQRLALSLERKKVWSEIFRYQQKAIDLTSNLMSRHPNDTSIKQEYAGARYNYGRLLARAERYPEAVPHLEASTAIRRQIAQVDPKDMRNLSLLGSDLRRMAEVQVKLGNLVAARRFGEECLQLRQRVASTDVDNKGALGEVAEAWVLMGDVHLAGGNRGDAQRSYRNALEIFEPLEKANLLSQPTLEDVRELRGKYTYAATGKLPSGPKSSQTSPE